MENLIARFRGFLDGETSSLIMVGTCVLVLLFIFGKLVGRLVRGLIAGAILSLLGSAALYFVICPATGLSAEVIPITSVILFVLGAIFGKIKLGP